MNRLGQSIRASLDLPEVLHAATHELGRALGASGVYIRPYDPERHDHSPVMYEYLAPGSGCQSVSAMGISYDKPIGRHLIETHRTLVIDDAANYDGGPPPLDEHVREMASSTAGLPNLT